MVKLGGDNERRVKNAGTHTPSVELVPSATSSASVEPRRRPPAYRSDSDHTITARVLEAQLSWECKRDSCAVGPVCTRLEPDVLVTQLGGEQGDVEPRRRQIVPVRLCQPHRDASPFSRSPAHPARACSFGPNLGCDGRWGRGRINNATCALGKR